MKRPIFLFFFVILGFTPLTAQEYIGTAGQNMSIVRDPSGKIGYLESVWGKDIKDAKVMIPYKFDWANEFDDAGFAVVEIASKFGVIDKTGKTIVPLEYDYAFRPANGIAVVYRNGKFGAVDMTGKLIVPLEYETLGSFDEYGQASAGKWGQDGIINKKNQVMLPFDYIQTAPAGEGFMQALSVSGWKHFDPAGKEILSGYEAAKMENGYFVTGKSRGQIGLFNKTGAPVLPEVYKSIEVGSNGTSVILKQNDLYGLFDLKTKSWLIPLENKDMSFEGDNMVRVAKTDEAGPAYLATISGQKLTTVNFQDVQKLFDLGFVVKHNGKWGLIDRAMRTVLPTEFAEGSIKPVSDDRIAAKRADDPSCKPCGWGMTDLKGNTILPFYYAKPDRNFFSKTIDGKLDTNPFDYGSESDKYDVVVDLRTGKPGVVDTHGNWILKPGGPYDDMKLFGASSSLLPVKKNGKWGVYELNTRREIVPPTVSIDDFSELEDKYTYGTFYDRAAAGWGFVIYETGQIFKPGTFSYEDYDSETKLLIVTKGTKSGSPGFEGTEAQKKALELVSGSSDLKGLMRLDGTMVTKLEYSKLSFDYNAGSLYWAVKNGKGGWIDVNGRTIIPHVYDLAITEPNSGLLAIGDSASFDSNGFAKVIYQGEVVLIDKKGKIVKRATDLGVPRHAYLGKKDLGKIRYFYVSYDIDRKNHYKFLINGKIYQKEKEEDGLYFYEGLEPVKRSGLYGYIDRAGNEVTPFIYSKAQNFFGGIAYVETEKESFYINREGRRLYSIDVNVIVYRRGRGLTTVLNSEVVRTIDVADAKKQFDAGAVFVDTRAGTDFAEEHIKGAVNITKTALEANLSLVPKSKTIIAYCSCPREESAGAVIYELKKKGYTEVYALRGGTKAWKEAGFPMEK